MSFSPLRLNHAVLDHWSGTRTASRVVLDSEEHTS